MCPRFLLANFLTSVNGQHFPKRLSRIVPVQS
ncbi:hypothetical protein Bhyg_03300 [Pseudolycoriella hygida]|uniref:Uncharacterized protein n=1 Tax=Pseudolycoriella hygida TaxID=35572 RepID=A0A9Q0ND39_9DIPT|nr:hypothetical protein Bhyg_03300 [Pseudolycoriella hygida]